MLALGMALGVLLVGCTPGPGVTPTSTASPGSSGIQDIPPPAQFSRAVTHEPSVTETETSQALEYETALEPAAIIQFYKDELPRRGWSQVWEIAGEGQHQVDFERQGTETVIVVATEDTQPVEGATPPPRLTRVGILYISAKG